MMTHRKLATAKDAYELMRKLGASKRLIRHTELVSEAAEELIEELESLAVDIDADSVRVGAIIHDAGKIIHPEELAGEGDQHEHAGRALLLQHGVEPRIARFCLSHAHWNSTECTLEELLVAASDKLWKGKRDNELEMTIIDRITRLIGKDRWEVFDELDTSFETIANGGADRLRRSHV